jgi:flagellar basal body-associated protein FliL
MYDPNAPQPPYGQSPYTSPYEQQYSPAQPAYPPTTQYGASPPSVQPVYIPPPQKSSAKTVWIVLGVVGAVLLLVGGGCCFAFFFVFNRAGQAVQSVSTQIAATVTAGQQTAVASEPAPSQQAQNYYLAISVQDYTNAYSYLAVNMTTTDGKKLTQALYVQQAQALDASEGRVTDYTVTADPGEQTKATVQVTRSKGATYTVHLTFIQSTDQWVISSFDSI